MTTKTCTKCKETKPVSEFGRNRHNKDDLASSCKTCASEKGRRHYEANKERILDRQRRYREANREKINERCRRYYQSNKEKIAERSRKYREANKEKEAEQRRRRYEANREQEKRTNGKRRKEANDRSLELAHRHRQPWEDWEDEFVMADNELTIYQKAVKLGRTRASVNDRRMYLRKSARAELTNDN